MKSRIQKLLSSKNAVLAPFLIANLLLLGSQTFDLSSQLRERSVQRDVEQLAVELRAKPEAEKPFIKFFERVADKQSFSAPFAHLQASPQTTLVAYRLKYGYSGYQFDMVWTAGWDERSALVHSVLDYRVNGQRYQFSQTNNRVPAVARHAGSSEKSVRSAAIGKFVRGKVDA